MTVKIVSKNKHFSIRCKEIFRANGHEIVTSEADILIFDTDIQPLTEFGRRRTIVISAWDAMRYAIPEGVRFFLKPVDVEYVCGVGMGL